MSIKNSVLNKRVSVTNTKLADSFIVKNDSTGMNIRGLLTTGDKIFLEGSVANYSIKISGNTVTLGFISESGKPGIIKFAIREVNEVSLVFADGSLDIANRAGKGNLVIVGDTADVTIAGGTTAVSDYVGAAAFDVNEVFNGGAAANVTPGFALTATADAVQEGGNVTFRLELDREATETVTVTYSTSSGSATAADFINGAGQVTFIAGQKVAFVTIHTVDDAIVEPNEVFTLNVTGPRLTAPAVGTATITSEDALPAFTVTASADPVQEGGTVTFRLVLDRPATEVVTVNYSTTSGSATSADFTQTVGQATFAVGQQVATVTINTINDALVEQDETFTLNINGPRLTAPASAVATVTSEDLPPPFTLVASADAAQEGGLVTFRLVLDRPATEVVTVDYGTGSGTATSDDFTQGLGQVTFVVGQQVAFVTVQTTDDGTFEATEGFTLSLSGPRLTAPVTAAGTIVNDDIDQTALSHTFTLKQVDVSVTGPDTVEIVDGEVVVVKTPIITLVDPIITRATYWVTPETGEGAPIADLLDLIETYAGLNFVELGLINIANGTDSGTVNGTSVQLPPQVVDFTITSTNTSSDSSSTSGMVDVVLSVTFDNGDVNTAEVTISEQYFALINNLLFDANGNGRLVEKEIEVFSYLPLLARDADGDLIPDGLGGFVVALDVNGDPIPVRAYDVQFITTTTTAEGTVVVTPGVTVINHPDIILTTTENNGSTVEGGLPTLTVGHDTIVVNELQLLNGAYIDAGAGRNTLEIDANTGGIVRPLALMNIQEVRVQNLAETGNAILDLSRADSLDRLVITEGQSDDLNPDGDLLIVGVRNGAVTRFEGAFDQDITVHYGEGRSDDEPLTVELLLGVVTGDLNIAHNTDSLHLVSLGGGSNTFGTEDLGGRLSDLKISGNAALHIRGDLNGSFQSESPVSIDASENEGGVSIHLDETESLTFIGSQGNDELQAHDGGLVIVQGGAANNTYDIEANDVRITNADGENSYTVTAGVVTIEAGDGNNSHVVRVNESAVITSGDGDNQYTVVGTGVSDAATITSGNGDNTYTLNGLVTAVVTAGNGDNEVAATADDLSIALGNGNNEIQANADDLSITVGNGNNDIEVASEGSVSVLAGTGVNQFVLEGEAESLSYTAAGPGANSVTGFADTVTVTTGDGVDIIDVGGSVITINTAGGNDTITIRGADDDYTDNDGALLNINTGLGNATINLGGDDAGSITAKQGSVIAGENITLVVSTTADLRAATLPSTITKVILDDDVNEDGGVLTLTDVQFLAIGAAKFSVDGSIFNTHALIKIIVTTSTSLTALGVNSLQANIDLQLEVNDGVTLTMTAQQLHERVAEDGVTLGQQDLTDKLSGKIVITGAGSGFDPFNESDAPRSSFGDAEYTGGSLSDADFGADGLGAHNVTIRAGFNGYNRPADAENSHVVVIDTTNPLEQTTTAQETFISNLEIIGDSDATFTGAINLGEGFTVDFSQLEGEVVNFTLADFQDVKLVRGNSTEGYDATVYVQLLGEAGDDSVEGGAGVPELVSSGVDKYIVVDITDGDTQTRDDEEATITLSDATLDLETIGLRGNWNATLNLRDMQAHVAIELQGDGKVASTTNANGDPAFSNVGVVNVKYEFEGADAVVNLNNQGTALTTRSLHVAGIEIDNADSITLNVVDGKAVIDHITGDDLEALDINASSNVSITDELDLGTITTIDAAGVLGTFTATVEGDGADSLVFIGAAGATTLTLDDVNADADSSFASAGTLTLVIAEDTASNLEQADVSDVDFVVLEDDAELFLTVAQANDIGTGNFSLASGANNAELNLSGLDESLFTLAAYADGITVGILTVAAQPVVTLHPMTNLTGITELEVPEGTVLNLTAAQFQQLTGAGLISGVGTVNITGLTQADVDDGINLNGITADAGTITLAESVELQAADDLGNFDTIILVDNVTFTLATTQQANGLDISGGTNTTLALTDTFAAIGTIVDASGFDVTTLKILNVLVDDRNIESLFSGLDGSVTIEIYNDLGSVESIARKVVVNEGTTVPGFVVFNPQTTDTEIRTFELSLKGGVEISGDLRLSTTPKDANLIPTHLETLTINSTGTAANLQSGVAANVITGDITPEAGILPTARPNNLKQVVINATQDFVVEGDVVFSSLVGNDLIEANDDAAAIVSLTVNGTADVTLGGVDTSDDDVDGLNVVNNSTGTLDITINAAEIDAADDLSFTGAGDIELTLVGNINLSDDNLAAVSEITLADNATLTLSQAQLDALGTANLLTDGSPVGVTLHIVELGAAPFDATAVAAGMNVATVTIAAGVVTLDPTTNLTNVDSLIVADGSTLTLTAAQFQQLLGSGTITGGAFNLNITGLTQADIDLAGGFSLAGVADGASITLSLAESVELAANTNLDDLDRLDVVLADNQTLGLANITQADGLDVTGGLNSTLIYQFATGFGPFTTVDASGYDVTTLKLMDFLVDNRDVELLQDLDEDIIVRIFHDPTELGIRGIDRKVVVEENVSVPGFVVFNDYQADSEIVSLDLTFEGGASIDGNLRLTTIALNSPADDNLIATNFQTLTIRSEGTSPNAITGDIDPTVAVPVTIGGHTTAENNLLSVIIHAAQDFSVEGDIVFNKIGNNTAAGPVNDNASANLLVDGAADVSLGTLNTADNDVTGLNVANTGTGTLSLTIDSALSDAADALSFTGSNIEITSVGTFDLTNDILTGVSQITIDGNGVLTLTQAQFDALDVLPDADLGTTAQLHLTAFGSDPFDGSAIPAGVNVASITMVAGNVVLDAATNLTGVDQIIVPAGGTLTLTAAQFQQLDGVGTIVGVSGATNFTVNITDLTQADIDLNGATGTSFDLTGISATTKTITLLDNTVNLATDTEFGNVSQLEVFLADGQTLGVAEITQISPVANSGGAGAFAVEGSGITITGGVGSTVIFQFANQLGATQTVDASGLDIDVLKLLNLLVENRDIELLQNLDSSVDVVIYSNPGDVPGLVSPIFRTVILEENVTVDGFVVVNDYQGDSAVRTLDLTLSGNSVIDGNLRLTTVDADTGLVPLYFDTLTINSIGAPNAITGDVTASVIVPVTIGTNVTVENNLLKVVINADEDLTIGGDIVFSSVQASQTTATLTINGDSDVTIHAIDATDDDGVPGADITTVNIVNNSTGTFTATGGSPAFEGAVEVLNLSGQGDMVFGSALGAEGVTSSTISVINASALTGDLDLGIVNDIDSASFSFTAGTGVTELTLTDSALLDMSPVTTGWSFDLSASAAGSEFHLSSGLNTADVGALSINLGANATLFIDATTDLTTLDLTITQTNAIVLAAGVTLTLTAAQANGLDIVGGMGATVNVIGLGNTPVDLTGIAANIAGTITLEDNDVSLDAATDLGDFTILLTDIASANSLAGQTIRFATEAQAAADITVVPTLGDMAESTNVVWLFNAVTAPVDTSGYDADITRLWLNQTLANGANVEDLFTSLPSTIVRVDFSDLEELELLLNSVGVDRTIELVAFSTLANGLSFSDSDRLEHVSKLTLDLGGEVTVGDIELDNVVNPAAGVDVDGIVFSTLTINSQRALHQDHILAPEAYVNNNDGTNDAGEFAQPGNLNIVGDIGIGANNGLDLLTVVLNTGATSTLGGGLAGSQGANLQVGTITFDAEAGNIAPATVTVTGANNTTIASLNTTDPDITLLVVSNTGTGTLTITGASPAAAVSNTEELEINATGNVVLGTTGVLSKPGVAGDDLSLIDVNGTGNVSLGVISLVDGLSFALDATDNIGAVTATLGSDDVGAPALLAGGTWTFNNGDAPNGTLSLTLSDDVTLGAGTVNLNNLTLTIDGTVDFTTLLALNLDVTDVTIVVPAGSVLTLLAADADGLTIKGAGVVNVAQLEATPAADLSKIMTNLGDTGTVFATVNTNDDADLDLLPETVLLTGDLGIAEVTVSGNGTADATDATVAEVEDASFVVVAPASLVLTAAQADDLSVTGTGTTFVEDIGLHANANVVDLSGVVTAAVNIAVDTATTLNSADDLGAAGAGRVITIAQTVTLTSAGSVVDGQFIVGENATLLVDDENDMANTPITANLSNVDAEFITLVVGAEVGAITFPVLYGSPAAQDIDPLVAVQTVTLTAAQASAQTILGAAAGAEGAVVVNDLDNGFTNLSLIDAGEMTAHVADTPVVLHPATNLGDFDVELDAVNAVFTLTAAQADGLSITDVVAAADATVNVTDLEDAPAADLSGIVASVETAALDANGDVALSANLGANMDVTITDSVPGVLNNVVTFTGTLVQGSIAVPSTTFTLNSPVTLVLDAATANALTVADGAAGTEVIVNNLGSALVDFSNIDGDTLTANVPADATLNPASDLEDFDVVLAEGVDLGLTTAQLLAIDESDFSGTAGGVSETLIVSGYNGENIQSDELGANVVIQTLTLAAGNITVDPLADLTKVQEIVVPLGATLTMTADQFESMPTGVISGAGTLNITGLDSSNDEIDLSTVTALAGSITLDAMAAIVVLEPTAVLDNAAASKFSINLTANAQSLTLSSETQADGRVVNSGAFTATVLVLGFTNADAADADANMEAGGFDVAQVWVLNDYLFNEFTNAMPSQPANMEAILNDLATGIDIVFYDTEALLDAGVVAGDAVLGSTSREVIVQRETTVDADFVFNDLDTDNVVKTLDIVLNGNSVILGDIALPQDNSPQDFDNEVLKSLTIVSTLDPVLPALTSPNRIAGNIFADDGGNAESVVEVFTLQLANNISVVGTETKLSFEDVLISLADGDNTDAVGAKLAAATYANWTATYDAGTDTVTFSNRDVGVVTNVVAADFEVVNNNPASTGLGVGAGTTTLNAIVNTTVQGAFEDSENNLIDLNLEGNYDLDITGSVEFRYVTRSLALDEVTTTAVIDNTNSADITIGAVLVTDAHLSGLVVNNLGGGTLTGLGLSPAVTFGAAGETFEINTSMGSVTTFGTAGNASKPGVSGAELSLIDVNGPGTVNVGVLALVDDLDFELNAEDSTGDVTAEISADLADGGTWSFVNGGTGTLNLTINGDDGIVDGTDLGAGSLTLQGVNLTITGDVDFSNLVDDPMTAFTEEFVLTDTAIVIEEGSSLTLTAEQADGVTISGAGQLFIVGDYTGQSFSGLTVENMDLSGITSSINGPITLDVSAVVITRDGFTGFNIVGSDFANDITTGQYDDTIVGGPLDDVIDSGTGSDSITGGAGTDTIIVDATEADAVNLGTGLDFVEVDEKDDVRLTFTSAEVGNNNAQDGNDTAPNNPGALNSTAYSNIENGGLAVRFEVEDAAGLVNGEDLDGAGPLGAKTDGVTSRYDDEGIVYFSKHGQVFDVRDLGTGAARGDFEVVVLGTDASETFTAGAGSLAAVGALSDRYYINAGMGDDSITGGAQRDVLVGGGGTGNDTLTGAAGADLLIGGAGNDTYRFSTGDVVVGESIIDTAGTDTVFAVNSTDFSGLAGTLLTSSGIEQLLIATDATFTGAQLTGQAVAVNASSGVPVTLNIDVASGATVSFAGLTFADFTPMTTDSFALISGFDTIDIDGDVGAENITGTSLNDNISGGAGIDTFNVLSGTDTITDINNNDDDDVLIVAVGATANVTIVAADPGMDPFGTAGETANGWVATAATTNAGTVNITLEELAGGVDLALAGGPNGYTVTLADDDDYARGSAFNDTITGGDGEDTIIGGDGADSLVGGVGDDVFRFNTGDVDLGETLSAGDDFDTLHVQSSTDFTNLSSLTGIELIAINGEATFTGDQLSGQAITVNAEGASGTLNIDLDGGVADFSAFTFAGTNGFFGFSNVFDFIDIDGSANSDIITGSSFGENIDGGEAADTILGGGGNDTILGGGGADSIDGGTGNDVLTGNGGNDTIIGGADADIMTGNGGSNTYIIGSGSSGLTLETADTITDFDTAEDLIEIPVGASVIIEDGTAFDFAAFLAAADVAFDTVNVYVAYNVGGLGNAYVAVDQDVDLAVSANDSLIVLTGVNTAGEINSNDFI